MPVFMEGITLEMYSGSSGEMRVNLMRKGGSSLGVVLCERSITEMGLLARDVTLLTSSVLCIHAQLDDQQSEDAYVTALSEFPDDIWQSTQAVNADADGFVSTCIDFWQGINAEVSSQHMSVI